MGLSMDKQMLKFTKLLRKVVEDSTSKEVMKEVGEQTVKLVQQQAKLGNDYLTGGKFKGLSSEYIDKRKDHKGELHERTRPRKSNVTATGQMVDSLKVSDIRNRSVEVEVSGTRRKSSFGNTKTNAEVAYWVEKNGRHWLGLTEKSKKKLQMFYKRIVTSMARRQDRK